MPGFQIWDKKWWPVWTLQLIGEKHKAFDVGGLWYCSFYHPLGRFQNSETCIIRRSGTGTTVSASSVFTHTRIPLFDLYTTANDKSWCQVRNALKSVIIQDLILSDQYLTIKFQRKSSDFWFFRPQFKFWNGPFQMDIQIIEYSPFWNFLEYSRIVWDVSFIV